jgi:hypothetical protein
MAGGGAFCQCIAKVAAIGDADAAAAIGASHFRFGAKMRELETQFEAKAAELRAEFVAEISAITNPGRGRGMTPVDPALPPRGAPGAKPGAFLRARCGYEIRSLIHTWHKSLILWRGRREGTRAFLFARQASHSGGDPSIWPGSRGSNVQDFAFNLETVTGPGWIWPRASEVSGSRWA